MVVQKFANSFGSAVRDYLLSLYNAMFVGLLAVKFEVQVVLAV